MRRRKRKSAGGALAAPACSPMRGFAGTPGAADVAPHSHHVCPAGTSPPGCSAGLGSREGSVLVCGHEPGCPQDDAAPSLEDGRIAGLIHTSHHWPPSLGGFHPGGKLLVVGMPLAGSPWAATGDMEQIFAFANAVVAIGVMMKSGYVLDHMENLWVQGDLPVLRSLFPRCHCHGAVPQGSPCFHSLAPARRSHPQH